jgi:hypothetical protein
MGGRAAKREGDSPVIKPELKQILWRGRSKEGGKETYGENSDHASG